MSDRVVTSREAPEGDLPGPPGGEGERSAWRAEGLLLLASVIWGFAFVAQRAGMAHVGPFLFNGVRFALGALVLLPFARRSFRRGGGRLGAPPPGKRVLLAGAIAGVVLFLASSTQQIGIVQTTAGKAGFITGLYVVLVPILGLFVGQRPGPAVWFAALLAVAGLYLLSVTASMRLAPGDGWVVACAFLFAVHVLLIGSLSGRERLPAIPLAATQFAVVSALSLAVSLFAEDATAAGLRGAAIPILYGGVLSVGVAYTLQVAGQRGAPPAAAAILLSLESVFAAIGGAWLLGESLRGRALAGCALMLLGIVLSQSGTARGRRRARRAAAAGASGGE